MQKINGRASRFMRLESSGSGALKSSCSRWEYFKTPGERRILRRIIHTAISKGNPYGARAMAERVADQEHSRRAKTGTR